MVRIVTDSVADLPPSVARELGVMVVPLNVRFGEKVYRDGIDLTSEQFYDKLKYSKTLPFTSVPSPAAFAEVYDELTEETGEIIAIILSSKFSGTYEVALQSVGMMKRNARVEVVDSQWAVMAQGFIVITAARVAQAGGSFDEVMNIILRTRQRVDIRAAFDTLEYLRRGGRIGAAQALLGSTLKLNPIITIKDGVVEPAGRTRSRIKAIDFLYDFAMSYSHIEEIAIEDAACPNDAESLVERLNTRFPGQYVYRSKTTPIIGTHTGPGLLLLAILGDK
ncbi:DegV family protein [Chloroflexota bacterium]